MAIILHSRLRARLVFIYVNKAMVCFLGLQCNTPPGAPLHVARHVQQIFKFRTGLDAARRPVGSFRATHVSLEKDISAHCDSSDADKCTWFLLFQVTKSQQTWEEHHWYLCTHGKHPHSCEQP
jgi:hypothetical protein